MQICVSKDTKYSNQSPEEGVSFLNTPACS